MVISNHRYRNISNLLFTYGCGPSKMVLFGGLFILHGFGRLNPLIRRMTITMIAIMINKIITLIVNIHPFPIKVKHRPKQNLSNMFLI